MELLFLQDSVVIFALSILVILCCHRLKIPSIVGFLLTGVLVGPHGLQFIQDVSIVETFAEIGIVLLLFSIGMEFSLKKILAFRRYFFLGGGLQVALTILFVLLAALVLYQPAGLVLYQPAGQTFHPSMGQAIFFGFLIALSSTAIVLRVLDERSETDTPHGRLVVGIMIFQDIVAIPMMLLTPLLNGAGMELSLDVLMGIGANLLALLAILAVAYRLIPLLLFYIAKTRSRELFLLSVLTLCFAVALLTSKIGLSLSLGAFLAGLLVSESEYRHQAVGDILPFRDVFTSFFFVSIGMLLDISFFFSHPFMLVLLTIAVLLLKVAAASIAGLCLKLPLRYSILTGVALCQIGEFSFVLAKNGLALELISPYSYQVFLTVSLLSMGLTPWLISSSPQLVALLSRLPFPARLKTGLRESHSTPQAKLQDHIIIIGFGLSGRQLAASAKSANIPYVILEMNPETVAEEQKKGEPIYFGDGAHASVLKHIGIAHARLATVVINDAAASRRIVELMHRINPHLYIQVRTRYFNQTAAFYQLGANDVIPDELGSSVEIFSRALQIFQIPQERIDDLIENIRKNLYFNLCPSQRAHSSLYELKFSLRDLGVESFKIDAACKWVGKSLAEVNLRQQHGITVVAIKRNTTTISHIDASTVILGDDILTVTGRHVNLSETKKFLKALIST